MRVFIRLALKIISIRVGLILRSNILANCFISGKYIVNFVVTFVWLFNNGMMTSFERSDISIKKLSTILVLRGRQAYRYYEIRIITQKLHQ